MAYANSAPCPDSGQVHFFAGRFGQSHLSVLANRELSDADTRVYGILAAHRNAQSGKAWPKRSTVAALAGVHPDSVSRSTARLEGLGFLVKVHRGGPGNGTIYTFPLLDERQATVPKASPKPAPARASDAEPTRKPRKPRAARVYPDATVSATGADTIEREFRETKTNPKPLPLPAEPMASVDVACGESFPETLAPNQDEHGHEAPANGLHGAEPREPEPSALAFPEGLTLALCAQLARMLAGIPFADAQAILDEMAFNARAHGVNNPGGYTRKLLREYKAGAFKPEVAQFERQRREHRRRLEAEIERAKRIRPEDALIPKPPPPARTPEQTARGLEAIANMKAMLKARRH
jgi:hypothetical protein